jgi:hypothetical protein
MAITDRKKRSASKTTAKVKPRAPKKTPAKKRTPAEKPAVEPERSLTELLADLNVETAVRRELERIGARDADLATSGMAANALQLAKEMDAKNSATSKSMCARALNETLKELKALSPEPVTPDALDEVGKKRIERREKAGIA